MRHIAIDTFKASDEWKKLAADAKTTLLNRKPADRINYIKSKDDVWKALGKEFIDHFGNKCWYTDAANYGARLDVEHFRPKAKVVELTEKDCKEATDSLLLKLPDAEREGYWWLAFDEENLLLCAQVMNREDKRNFFPLHRDSPFATGTTQASWRNEVPVLLDPRKLDDVCLVDYDETGAMRPREGVEPWEHFRVVVTDQCFGLSRFQPLTEGRQRMWQKCTQHIDKYIKALKKQNDEGTPNLALQQEKNDALLSLWALLDPAEAFSTVAASCLRNSPYKWAQALASQPPPRTQAAPAMPVPPIKNATTKKSRPPSSKNGTPASAPVAAKTMKHQSKQPPEKAKTGKKQ